MAGWRASDLFLRTGSPPAIRVDGKIARTDLPAQGEEEMSSFLARILTPAARRRFERTSDLDVAWTVPGSGRYRINLFRHQGSLGLVARRIPLGAVEFAGLGLPPAILEMAASRSGLILVAGPTGCGKSTTLAALLHHINSTRDDHIVTIEDPIEFVHEEIRSLVHQRQVGSDTRSFARALRHVVRQSPDAIMIGEMRDFETVSTALSAALTGHLILSSLHTTSVVQSIDRILNLFPPDYRPQAQADLASTLVGIVALRLLPRRSGEGRAPAVEVLRSTPTVRRIISEGKFAELQEVMKRGGDSGMMTLTQSLGSLVRSGTISEEAAMRQAPNPDELRLNLEGMFTGIDSIDRRNEPPDGRQPEDERGRRTRR